MIEEKNILIIGGEESICKALKKELVKKGYGVEEIIDVDNGLNELEDKEFQVALISSEVQDLDGNRILKCLKDAYPYIEVIVVAEHSTMRSAFDSMRLGAYDYLTKPFDLDKVISTVERAVQHWRKYRRVLEGSRGLSVGSLPSNIVVESSAMKSIWDLIQKVAPADCAVLVQGETGTGKGLIADAIHRNSLRRNSPFIVVNCGAIPENLLESELFGFEKGAFTDATRLKRGLLEETDGGTLFLDEVSEIRPSLQSKLLRVVETGDFRRLGSNEEIRVDLRIVSATNKDLYKEVVSRRFREDLYYRLSVVSITVPPLRERREDIPLLVAFFLKNLKVSGKGKKAISPEALEMLKEYDWPGNIRELRNVIERVIILTERNNIEVGDLPLMIQKHKTLKQLFLIPPEERYLTLEEMEKMYIEKVLESCRGHKSRAAEILGITRHTLYNKLKRFGIDERKNTSSKSFRKDSPPNFGK